MKYCSKTYKNDFDYVVSTDKFDEISGRTVLAKQFSICTMENSMLTCKMQNKNQICNRGDCREWYKHFCTNRLRSILRKKRLQKTEARASRSCTIVVREKETPFAPLNHKKGMSVGNKMWAYGLLDGGSSPVWWSGHKYSLTLSPFTRHVKECAAPRIPFRDSNSLIW